METVQKSDEELLIDPLSEKIYNIQAVTLGAVYKVASWFNTDTALGFHLTQNFAPQSLETLYGNNPLSLQVFIRIIPGLFKTYN